MQVNQDLEAVRPCPSDSLVQVLHRSLDERLASLHVPCPVAHGEANVIETGRLTSALKTGADHQMQALKKAKGLTGHLHKVLLGDEGVPVLS